jgi:uncharacterized surface protein with fasciclin (FAS1) repeats
MNIAETVVNHGSCETLAAAVKAADLVDTLSSEGPLTVFAPIDDAFGKLPEGSVEKLLKTENKEQLTSILTYHVLAGKIMSTDLSDGMKAKTVNGKEVTVHLKEGKVHLKEGKVFINDAEVVLADVETDNGIIHAVDKVIMPA